MLKPVSFDKSHGSGGSAYVKSAKRGHSRRGDEGDDNWFPIYDDIGCRFFSSCLSCPLETCVYDVQETGVSIRAHIKQEWARGKRGASLAYVYALSGNGVNMEHVPEDVWPDIPASRVARSRANI